MRTILAVGAYERDNFGDYLFLEVLKRALEGDEVIPGSVISTDMTEKYGIITIPYSYVLDNYKVDAVWVVGGEVGGVRVPIALDMSLDRHIGYFDSMAGPRLDRILKILGANNVGRRAYIPDMSQYYHNIKTPIVINSVGLDNLFADTRDNARLLTQASIISVREHDSFDIANESRVANIRISPDVVHALSRYYTPKSMTGGNSGGVLIQINESTISKIGVEAVKTAIRSVYKYTKLPVRLFAAGTAAGHDSTELYENIVSDLTDIKISIIYTRNPLEIVDYIANAHMVIATSLHVRIVAATYGVKRISLQNNKVERYSSAWDNEWPTNIKLEDIVNAVRVAEGVCGELLRRDDLTEASYTNLQSIIDSLPSDDGRSSTTTTNAVLRGWYSQQQKEAIDSILYLGDSMVASNHRIDEIEAELRQIKQSRKWKTLGYIGHIKNRALKRWVL